MRVLMFLLISVFSVFVSSSEKKEETKEEVKTEESVVKGTQEKCPITGSKIKSEHKLDFQGQRIYFCSADCSSKFKILPDDCFKMIEKKGHVVDNIQKKCPVDDKDLGEGKVAIKLPGRNVYVCCAECVEPFKKDEKNMAEKAK